MHGNSLLSRALTDLGAFTKPATQAQLDAVAAEKQVLLDATANAAGSHAASGIRDDAIASLLVWAGTPASDLDEGESLADRLIAMAVGIADDNKDGEISDEEADVAGLALQAMADYLVAKGVTESDVSALLDEGSAEAADRVHEFLAGEAGDDAAVDSFVFDAESSEAVMDGVLDSLGMLDAVYKRKVAVRKGKKVRIMKRVSGHVRLSAGQKVAIRKAARKAHSAGARMRRMKSMKVRARAGL